MHYLEFERPIAELEGKIVELRKLAETDPAMERTHLHEVRRRRAAVRAGDSKLVDGDEAMRQVRSALG